MSKSELRDFEQMSSFSVMVRASFEDGGLNLCPSDVGGSSAAARQTPLSEHPQTLVRPSTASLTVNVTTSRYPTIIYAENLPNGYWADRYHQTSPWIMSKFSVQGEGICLVLYTLSLPILRTCERDVRHVHVRGLRAPVGCCQLNWRSLSLAVVPAARRCFRA